MRTALMLLLTACSVTKEDYIRTDGPMGVTDGPSDEPDDEDTGDASDTGDTGDTE